MDGPRHSEQRLRGSLVKNPHHRFINVAATLIVAMAFTAVATGCSKKPELTEAERTQAQALHALGYGEIFRTTLGAMCESENVATRSRICGKLGKLSNADIEQVALPHFSKHVSPEQAQKITGFYTSSAGKGIFDKMLSGLKKNETPTFTKDELTALAAFGKSSEGAAAREFAMDEEAAAQIMAELRK
jgi:hypothetical protein